MSLSDPNEEWEEAHRPRMPSSFSTLSDEDISPRFDREIGVIESLDLADEAASRILDSASPLARIRE